MPNVSLTRTHMTWYYHITNDTNRLFVFDRTDVWLSNHLCWLIMNHPDNKYIIIGRYITNMIWFPEDIIELLHKDNIIYSSNLTLEEALSIKAIDDKSLGLI